MRRSRPVSYTHLDVYKRQSNDRDPHVRTAVPVIVELTTRSLQVLESRLDTMDSIGRMQTILVIDDDESLRDTIGVMPVSYTHLDVYKRQCVIPGNINLAGADRLHGCIQRAHHHTPIDYRDRRRTGGRRPRYRGLFAARAPAPTRQDDCRADRQDQAGIRLRTAGPRVLSLSHVISPLVD